MVKDYTVPTLRLFSALSVTFVRWCQRSKRAPSPCIWGFPCQRWSQLPDCDVSPLPLPKAGCRWWWHSLSLTGRDGVECCSWACSQAFLDGSFAATHAAELCQVTARCYLVSGKHHHRHSCPPPHPTVINPKILTGNFRERESQGDEVYGGKLSVWIGLLLLLHGSATEPRWRDAAHPYITHH